MTAGQPAGRRAHARLGDRAPQPPQGTASARARSRDGREREGKKKEAVTPKRRRRARVLAPGRPSFPLPRLSLSPPLSRHRSVARMTSKGRGNRDGRAGLLRRRPGAGEARRDGGASLGGCPRADESGTASMAEGVSEGSRLQGKGRARKEEGWGYCGGSCERIDACQQGGSVVGVVLLGPSACAQPDHGWLLASLGVSLWEGGNPPNPSQPQKGREGGRNGADGGASSAGVGGR